MNDKEFSDFITLPRTFEKYRWYKPILVFIIGLILMLIFQVVVEETFSGLFGEAFINNLINGGYEVLNNPLAEFFSDLGVIIIIPALLRTDHFPLIYLQVGNGTLSYILRL